MKEIIRGRVLPLFTMRGFNILAIVDPYRPVQISFIIQSAWRHIETDIFPAVD